MQLSVVLGWPQLNAISGIESGPDAWRTTLSIAEALGNIDYQLRALWALWVDRTNAGDHRGALALAERFCALAVNASDPSDLCIGWRLQGRSLHMLGDQAGAYAQTTRMLRHYAPPQTRSHLVRFQYDQRANARATLARTLWLQGLVEQALEEAEGMIDEVLALNDTPTLCHCLSDGACFVALLSGDLDAAARYVGLLRRYSLSGALDVWHTYADAFAGMLAIRQGEAHQGIEQLAGSVATLQRAGFVLHLAAFRGILAEALAQSGRHAEALAEVDIALADCAASGEGWFLPELHRVRGQILRLEGSSDTGGPAEAALREARITARELAALGWELRSATSLADLWHQQGRHDEAVELLTPVIARFSEGFALPDYISATALSRTLRLGRTY